MLATTSRDVGQIAVVGNHLLEQSRSLRTRTIGIALAKVKAVSIQIIRDFPLHPDALIAYRSRLHQLRPAQLLAHKPDERCLMGEILGHGHFRETLRLASPSCRVEPEDQRIGRK